MAEHRRSQRTPPSSTLALHSCCSSTRQTHAAAVVVVAPVDEVAVAPICLRGPRSTARHQSQHSAREGTSNTLKDVRTHWRERVATNGRKIWRHTANIQILVEIFIRMLNHAGARYYAPADKIRYQSELQTLAVKNRPQSSSMLNRIV